MTASKEKCGYCGQMAKAKNCGYYRGVSMHNMNSCNCLNEAVKRGFVPIKPEKIKQVSRFD